jgi:hypothetical protein
VRIDVGRKTWFLVASVLATAICLGMGDVNGHSQGCREVSNEEAAKIIGGDVVCGYWQYCEFQNACPMAWCMSGFHKEPHASIKADINDLLGPCDENNSTCSLVYSGIPCFAE